MGGYIVIIVMGMNDVPTLGKADLGGPPWERGLVARIRELHLAWRTEKTYRHWAWRLARFCAPKPAEELTHEEVRRWLSHLAVEGRVSVATQKQALNAAVFLFREVFKRCSELFRGRRRGRYSNSQSPLYRLAGYLISAAFDSHQYETLRSLYVGGYSRIVHGLTAL